MVSAFHRITEILPDGLIQLHSATVFKKGLFTLILWIRQMLQYHKLCQHRPVIRGSFFCFHWGYAPHQRDLMVHQLITGLHLKITWALPLVNNIMPSVLLVSYTQQRPSALGYLEFPDAAQDRAFDANTALSLAHSEPELLCFHTTWPDTGMPVLPCPFGRAETEVACWWLRVYVMVIWCVGKGVRTGRRLALCSVHACVRRNKGCTFPKAFISVVLRHHKVCVWIWSPGKLGTRRSGTALRAYRDYVACK